MISILKNTIQITRGDTGIFNVEITNPDGTEYIPEEGDVVRFTVRKSPTSGDIYISKTGQEIIINPADTAKLPFGKYSYDIELTKSDGTVDTIIPPSTFEICEEVTY